MGVEFSPEDVLYLRRRSVESLATYGAYIDIPGKPLTDDPNGETFDTVESAMALHHRIICDAIQRTMERRYGRLIIMAPPGSAKSSYASVVAPTWAMGKWPRKRLIIAGHSAGIAVTQSKKARAIARTKRYQNIFNCELPKDSRAADEWSLTNGSTMIAGGILSGIAGHRVDGIIFDDPHASREAAESEVQRGKVWEEWIDNLRNRVTPGGFVIGILTRWHAEDWAGKILPEGWNGESGVFVGSDGLDWEVLCLAAKIETPAQMETDPLGRKMGEYLWPEWFTEEHWRQKDPALGSKEANTPSGRRSWYSMEQQVPHPDDGVLFRREDFRWYTEREVPKNLRYYMVGDWALTDELLKPDPDWTRVLVVGIDDGLAAGGDPRVFLRELYSARKDVDVTVPAVARLWKKWQAKRIRKYYGERGNIETLVQPLLRRELKDRRFPPIQTELLPTAGVGNKVMKSAGFRKLVENGQVYLPIEAEWSEGFVTECVGFPGLAHDDQVDCGSLVGRAIDDMLKAPGPGRAKVRPKPLTPLTYEWHEAMLELEREQVTTDDDFG